MNYSEAIEYIHSLPRFGFAPGLERIEKLTSRLGDPQKDLRFIHVAGTNGKGSVCTMLSSCLRKAGMKTGLFISPYVICFRERIQINGEYISEDELAELTDRVRAAGVETNEFEFITALAFLYFKMKGVDIVVLETGLGGRFDATNIIAAPRAAVITGIGLDHTAVLGNTVEQIAGEKCGIIKSGSLVFTTYKQPAGALSVITSAADVILPDPSELSVLSSDIAGNAFVYKGEKFKSSLVGEHQIENALLVIETLRALSLDTAAIKSGIADAVFPARLEVVSKEPLLLLDGAHNPHGAAALAQVLKHHKNITLLMGMMADKQCEETVALLAPLCERIVTVTVQNNPRALRAQTLAQMARQYCHNVTAAENYDSALREIKNSPTAVICGSLYLASEIRQKAINLYNNK